MQANDMKYLILIKLDKIDSSVTPGYEDDEISTILSNAQNRVFLRHYNAKGNKYLEGFESTEQSRRYLDQLIKSASISGTEISSSTSQVGIHPNGEFFDLPSDFLYCIEESAKTTTSGASEVNVKPVTHDYYNANIGNPYKQPYSKLVWRMDISKLVITDDPRVELIVDSGNAIVDYRLRYLRTLPDIVVDDDTPSNQVDCILNDIIHEEIVDEAVNMMTGTINPQLYQITNNEVNKSE